jgi:hypothetical protein
MPLQNSATIAFLVGLSLAARAESGPPEDAVIAPAPDCRHTSGDKLWTLRREARLAEILKALADLTCERFFVSRPLLDEKFTVDVGADPLSSFELHSRVEGALRARGIVLDLAPASRVRRAADTRLTTTPSPAPSVSVSGERLDKGIQCQANRCTLTREIADAILSDGAGFASSARIVPNFRDGKVIGFKLFAVRPGGYLARLLLRNGDTVLSLEGHELTSPETVLEAYAQLRGKSRLKLLLERQGEKMSIEYLIR